MVTIATVDDAEVDDEVAEEVNMDMDMNTCNFSSGMMDMNGPMTVSITISCYFKPFSDSYYRYTSADVFPLW